jgi:putative ABC transport system permease protein
MLGIILGEAVVISLAGGVLGCLLAAGLCFIVRNGPAAFPQLRNLSVDPPVALASVTVAVLVGLISSAIPAYGAARTSIIDATRHTG